MRSAIRKKMMGNYGTPQSLAYTGAGITLGGVVLDQGWLVVAAVGLVAIGATMIRFGFRSGQKISD